jgi:hypothetical protein
MLLFESQPSWLYNSLVTARMSMSAHPKPRKSTSVTFGDKRYGACGYAPGSATIKAMTRNKKQKKGFEQTNQTNQKE